MTEHSDESVDGVSQFGSALVARRLAGAATSARGRGRDSARAFASCSRVLVSVVCASCASPHVRAPSDASASAAPASPGPNAKSKDSKPEEQSGDSASKRLGNGRKSSAGALAVPGFEPAILVVPEGTTPLPLLVATHGAGGDPAWECERWSHVAQGRWVLLCPSGTPLRRGQAGSYFYPDHHALEREVTAGVAAARGALGARLATTGGAYVGFSQGATMGALMLVEHGENFAHLLLIEGGSHDWTLARATRFRETGGKSVFIVCGTPACSDHATRARPVLERAGLHAEVRAVPDGGHTELGPVGEEAEKLLETLAGAG